jgi:hypothetical protein
VIVVSLVPGISIPGEPLSCQSQVMSNRNIWSMKHETRDATTVKTAKKNALVSVPGIVVEGHRVASRPSKDYPYGTLERQKPFFKAKGLDLDRYFNGTLNISIVPLRFEIVKPTYTFLQIAWTDLHPPEDFSFSTCIVKFHGKVYKGFVYYPHPETKIRHFQNPSVIEVITESIPGIGYGASIELVLDSTEIKILAP